MRVWRIIICITLVTLGIAIGVVLHSWLLSRKASPKSKAPITAFLFQDVITTNELVAEFQSLRGVQPPEFRNAAEVLVNHITPDALPMAARIAVTQFSGSQSSVLLNLIFPKWVNTDPDGALDFASHQPFGEYQLGHLLDVCAERDPKIIEQWASTNSDSKLQSKALRSAVQVILEKDPEAAWRLNEKNPLHHDRDSLRQHIVISWGRKDPRAAVERVVQLTNSSDAQMLFHTAFGAWVQSDGAAALKWLDNVPDKRWRDGAIQQATSLIIREPELIAPLVATLPHGEDRQRSIANLARGWASKDIDAAWKWARTLPPGDAEVALQSIGNQAIAAGNISVAAKIVEQNANATFAPPLAGSVVGRLAQTDASAAADWIAHFPAGPTRNQALPIALNATARTDPAKATHLCIDDVPVVDRQFTLPAYVRAWAQSAPKAAADFVVHLPANGERVQLVRTVAAAWSESDTTAAVQWAISLPASERYSAQLALVDALAKTDLSAAARLLEATPFTGAVTNTAKAIFSDWAKQDFSANSQWAEKLQPGQLRDCAFYALSKWRLDSGDVPAAQALADRIQNKETAGSLRFEIIRNWVDHDARAAAEWVGKLGVSNFKYVELPSEHRAILRPQSQFRSAQGQDSQAYVQHPDALDLTLGKWARQEPALAAEFAATKLTSSDQKRGESIVTRIWMQTDYKAVTAWIVIRTPVTHHEFLLKQVASWLSHDNPAALMSWADSVPPDAVRDNVLYSLAMEMRFEKTRTAGQLVLEILDDERRMTCLRSIASQWSRQSPSEFKNWMRTNSLPASTKSDLLRTVGNAAR